MGHSKGALGGKLEGVVVSGGQGGTVLRKGPLRVRGDTDVPVPQQGRSYPVLGFYNNSLNCVCVLCILLYTHGNSQLTKIK